MRRFCALAISFALASCAAHDGAPSSLLPSAFDSQSLTLHSSVASAGGITTTQYAISRNFSGLGNLIVAYGGVYFGTSPVGWFNGHTVGDFGVVPISGYQGFFSNGTGGSMLAAGPDGAVYATATYQRSSDRVYVGGIERYDPYHRTEGAALTSQNSSDAVGRMAFDQSGRLWLFSQQFIGSPSQFGTPYITIVTHPGTNVQQTATVNLGSDYIFALVKGADGTMWGFGQTELATSPISFEYEAYRLSSNGTVGARFKIAKDGTALVGADAVLGPDGAFWALDPMNHQIHRITLSGSTSSYTTPSAIRLQQIAAGGDGALWATQSDSTGAKVDRITTSGQQTEYALPSACSGNAYGVTGPGTSGLPWSVYVYCVGSLLQITH